MTLGCSCRSWSGQSARQLKSLAVCVELAPCLGPERVDRTTAKGLVRDHAEVEKGGRNQNDHE